MHSPTSKRYILLIGALLATSVASETICGEVCKEVFDLTNAERVKAGKSELCLNDLLMQAAQAHSEDQENMSQMSHSGSDGSSPGDRITAVGYEWRAYAENVAFGYSTAASVVNGWMNSPGHKANILGGTKNIGIGLASSPDAPTRYYWTQKFGTKMSGDGCDGKFSGDSGSGTDTGSGTGTGSGTDTGSGSDDDAGALDGQCDCVEPCLIADDGTWCYVSDGCTTANIGNASGKRWKYCELEDTADQGDDEDFEQGDHEQSTNEVPTMPCGPACVALVTNVNEQRKSHDSSLDSLCISNALMVAAQTHAEDMQKLGVATHTGSDGSTTSQRLGSVGYRYSDHHEGIGSGHSDYTSFITAMWKQQTTALKLVNSAYTNIGVGSFNGYWSVIVATKDTTAAISKSCDGYVSQQDATSITASELATHSTPAPGNTGSTGAMSIPSLCTAVCALFAIAAMW